jgi:hypothetical protein
VVLTPAAHGTALLHVPAVRQGGDVEQHMELRAVGAGQRRVHRHRVLADRADGGEQRRGRVGGLREAVLPRRDELPRVPA